ncbi:MAG: bifunctional folylpolyglutamate synthase/dihydrofolate synthase [Deltaproteobacteria bacterium]|nr:bifunctional folylpolyglutamate synthase/dihydrofolate synthase [Deltaproteobacteria bacterium]
MNPMTHQDNLQYISGLQRFGIRLGLAPVHRLLERLGHPQRNFRSILVGGTNGKGSICAMTSSMLIHHGHRVGLYTSPHLIDLGERIRVDGRVIQNDEMDSCIDAVRREVKEGITYFEFVTALAFLHFSRQGVDVAVVEVGMGGRLDATNVLHPDVSVISNVSLEHREHLGKRLVDIAREKGGIIKDNGICITAASQERVLDVLEGICRDRKARLWRIGRDFKIRRHGNNTFSYRGITKNYRQLACPFAGSHQVANAGVALGIMEAMALCGLAVDDGAVARGLSEARWPGRLEVLGQAPMLLVDGAHNPAGASALCRALKEEFTYDRLVLVFGVLDDKDSRSMLRKLLPLADRVILTKPNAERAKPPEMLLPLALQWHDRIELARTSDEALQLALSGTRAHDLICVTGSLYLVGEVSQAVSSGLSGLKEGANDA